MGVGHIGRALHHPNYRLFFGGQSISLLGTWMQRIAMNWLVYRLTSSPFLLGVVGFTGHLPIFILTPFAGVLADRWNRHRVIVVTQILSMLQALTLAILVLTGTVQVWHIISLGIILGVVDAFDIPTRQSFVVQMVENREDLANAIALNSSMVNVARLVGPSVAGLLIASVGEGMCFLLNGISYIAVILSLLAMKIKPLKMKAQRTPIVHGLKEGVSYAYRSTRIRSILLLVALVSLTGMPYTVLMPVFARDILHGDSHTLGFLMGASGFGALIGAFFLAARRNVAGLERWNVLGAAIFGAGLMAFSLSRSVLISLSLMLTTGFGMIVQHASGNTVLQTHVDEDKRGRIMSLFVMAIRGVIPFGSLLAGSLASHMGAPRTLMICGGSCLLGSLLVSRGLRKWSEGRWEDPPRPSAGSPDVSPRSTPSEKSASQEHGS
jgi:MFS family permease